MPPRPRTDTRERILDAATAVMRQVGAANLTLDAVAAEAGISKGGLLYHFASKDALLRGMVEHGMAQHVRDLEAARLRFDDTTGGYLQAFVEAQIEGQAHKRQEPHTTRSFIAAAANTPELLERPRQHAKAHLDILRGTGAHFIDALLLSLAMDGLFFSETFEMLELDETERRALIDALKQRAAAIAAQLDGGAPTS
ncbi:MULTISPECIES: TetR/AcrR family transcriptional regulator [Luteimonas]|uniref:TetR/AcrR family transcriptional regulator n=1 Tax=Luteimonas TaxID=83614 RepID=UPI000C7C0EE2|nr:MULTISPECIES: TetR/AcrR family transcriptional regulator [Luteimonas]